MNRWMDQVVYKWNLRKWIPHLLNKTSFSRCHAKSRFHETDIELLCPHLQRILIKFIINNVGTHLNVPHMWWHPFECSSTTSCTTPNVHLVYVISVPHVLQSNPPDLFFPSTTPNPRELRPTLWHWTMWYGTKPDRRSRRHSEHHGAPGTGR